MKRTNLIKGWLLTALLPLVQLTWAQSLTLQECFHAAMESSPIRQQQLYHESIARLKSENANLLNYPNLQFLGSASYQSDVFSLPFSTPNMENPTIPKDRYQLAVSLNQTIYDGGRSARTRDAAQAESRVNEQQVTVNLYQLKDILNQLFFGVLVAQENEMILDTLIVTLSRQLQEIQSKVRNGMLLASNALRLQKEILSSQQQLIEISNSKRALLEMLSAWIEKDISSSSLLAVPDIEFSDNPNLYRPELTFYDLQILHIDARQSLMALNNSPRLSLFADGGWSRPNPYNFFKTDFSPFYLTGIKLQWKFLDWGENKNELKVFDLQKEIVNSYKQDFRKNISIQLLENQLEITKLNELLAKDREILELQDQIVKESYAQLQNGLITSSQYVVELNNQTRARISTRIRELKLLQTRVDLLVKSGNI